MALRFQFHLYLIIKHLPAYPSWHFCKKGPTILCNQPALPSQQQQPLGLSASSTGSSPSTQPRASRSSESPPARSRIEGRSIPSALPRPRDPASDQVPVLPSFLHLPSPPAFLLSLPLSCLGLFPAGTWRRRSSSSLHQLDRICGRPSRQDLHRADASATAQSPAAEHLARARAPSCLHPPVLLCLAGQEPQHPRRRPLAHWLNTGTHGVRHRHHTLASLQRICHRVVLLSLPTQPQSSYLCCKMKVVKIIVPPRSFASKPIDLYTPVSLQHQKSASRGQEQNEEINPVRGKEGRKGINSAMGFLRSKQWRP